MKLAAAQVAGFLKNPGACRVVLLYGDDAGMIRDRAEMLVRAVKLGLSCDEIAIPVDAADRRKTGFGRALLHILRHATMR